MLVKQTLEKSIESALEKAMKEAFAATFELNSSNDDDVQSQINKAKDEISKKFAEKAKTCAADIASAIEEFVKSAQITINAGISITPAPGLISPMGPVTGVITVSSPVILENSIN